MTKKQKKRLCILIACTAIVLTVIVLLITLICNALFGNPIKGKWVSNDGTYSYEFLKDDTMSAEFKNGKIPILNIEYSGKVNGTYDLDKGDKTVTITLNYFSKNLTKNYSYTIENHSLKLKDLQTGQSFSLKSAE